MEPPASLHAPRKEAGNSLRETLHRGAASLLQTLDALFCPPCCLLCKRPLVEGERHLCTFCTAGLPFEDPHIHRLPPYAEEFAPEYRPERLYSLFQYDRLDNHKQLIYRIKYHSDLPLARHLGFLLGTRIAPVCNADSLLPVPLHARRQRQRGFNQAREIAYGMSLALGIELLDDVLLRVRHTPAQTRRNARERRTNLSGAFRLLHPERLAGRRFLLVDDVITTGTTVSACIEALAPAGKLRYSLACLARTQISI